MNDFDPLSTRDFLKTVLPAWLVDNVLAPFSDEVGLSSVIVKWLLVLAVTFRLVDALLSADLVEYFARGWIVAGLAMVVVALVPWRN